jgi:tetratricopeptide (TPR) repeat protein
MPDDPRLYPNTSGVPRPIDANSAKPDQGPLVPPWEQRKIGDEQPEQGEGGADFFISYAKQDLWTVRWIADCLQENGYSVHYQDRDFAPGNEFPREIDENLTRARRVIAIVSRASLNSEWCRSEWHAAGAKILPIRIENVSINGLLGNRTYIDLFGPGMDQERRREALLAAIAGRQTALADTKQPRTSIELPARCLPFVGRKDLLAEIYRHFFGPGLGARRLTLAGIAGVGKTALAVEYGYRMREHNAYSRIWYVQAGSPETLETQLWELVRELKIPQRDHALADELRQSLSREERWLIILDEAPDFAAVNDYIRTLEQGHILITSENPSTWGRGNVLEVKGWSLEEGTSFLMQETGSHDRRAAEDLVEEFDAHPERLIRAASYIDRTGISIARYLAAYRDRQVHQHDKFAATLALALDKLVDHPLALDLLRLGAFLGPERVPVAVLKDGLQAAAKQPVDDPQFDWAVQPLLQFSLARRDDPYLTFSRLVQGQVRSSAEERGESAKWLEVVLAVLDHLFPQVSEMSDPTVWPRAAELLPHVLAVINQARRAQIALPTVGRLLGRAAHFVGGPADPWVGFKTSTTRNFGLPYSSYGETATAVTLFQDARRILDACDANSLDKSEVMAGLGELHRVHSRYKEAISALAEAYDITIRSGGPASVIGALRLTQLARAQRDAGLVSLACKNLETAVRIAEQAGSEGRHALSEALAGYGIALSFLGRHPEAIADLRRAVGLEEAIFGTDSIEVSTTLACLADVLSAYGDRQATRDAVDRMIRIERNAYGDASAARCHGLSVASRNAINSGDPGKAHAWAIEMLALAGEEVRADDQTVSAGYLLQGMADRLLKGSQWRALIEKAGQALIAAGLPNVQPRLTIAGYLIEDGLVREAAELAARVMDEQVSAGDWASATDAALLEARARREAGQLEQAERRLRSFIEMLGTCTDIDEALAISAQLDLGETLLDFDRRDEALSAYEAAHNLAVQRGRVLQQAEAQVSKGQILLDADKIEEAIIAFREGLDLYRANLIKGHPAVVDAQLRLGRAEGVRGNETEARKQLDAAVAATAEMAGACSAEVGRLYVKVAEILGALERDVEANARAEEGLRVLQMTSQDAKDALSAATDVGFCMLAIGNLDRARELATTARALARDGAGQRIEWLRANQLAVLVAVEGDDLPAARTIGHDLAEMLDTDPDIPRRLKAAYWLILADIAPDTEQALRAVNEARKLNVDVFNWPRRLIGLRAAELNRLLGNNEEAMTLARQLLTDAHGPFRLDVLRVLVQAALGAGQNMNAADLIVQASVLAEKEQDPLRRFTHRVWIADAFRSLGNQDAARAALDAACKGLRSYKETVQPRKIRELAGHYVQLANLYSAFQDQAGRLDALEQAADLYRRADDRVALATVMNDLAAATLTQGELQASRQWLERVQSQLPKLGSKEATVLIQANLGLRYLDLKENKLARDALERALADWDRIHPSGAPGTAQLLAPLIWVFVALGDLEAATRHAERAVSCSLLDEEVGSPRVLDALWELARSQRSDDSAFRHVVDLMRRLAERRLTPLEQARLLGSLAQLRAEDRGWDELAFELMEQANHRLSSIEGPVGAVLADISILRAAALVARRDEVGAVEALKASSELLRTSADQESLVAVLAMLGDLQLRRKDAEAAAESYGEALRTLDSLNGSLASRLELLISLAKADLEKGARSEGVSALRRASVLTEATELPVDVATVNAICRLASALLHDADDRMRAGALLERAHSLNERMLDADQPQTQAVPALVGIVHDLRGVKPAMNVIESALRRVPNGSGGLEALMTLVIQADLDAEKTLDFITQPDDPEVLATTSGLLAHAFQTKGRVDDAKAVLWRAIDRLQSLGGAAPLRELALLLWLSDLDKSDDHTEARLALEGAQKVIRDHPELGDRLPELQTQLGVAFGRAGMWRQALEILTGLENETAKQYFNVGHVMIGDYEQAIDGLSRLVDEHPDPWLLYCLAIAENECGQKQAALDTAAQALSSSSRLIPALLLLCARICNDIAEYAAAIEYSRAVLKMEPSKSSAYAAMAWALQHLGPTRGRECEAAFQKVLDLSSEASERLYALKGRAGARRVLGQAAEARADYEQVLELLEPGGDPWLEGWVRYNLGQYDAAANAYQQAIDKDENRIAARFDLALCQAVGGKPEAVESYRATLARLDEREPRARLAPLRVARNDLRDAELIHRELATVPIFRTIVDDIETRLQRTEALVVRPILPPIPPIDTEKVIGDGASADVAA